MASGVDSQETFGKVEHGASLELRSGRPDFRDVVAKEVEATPYSQCVLFLPPRLLLRLLNLACPSWIAIGACGPTPMNDSLADAVSEAVQPRRVLRGEVRRNIYLTIEYVSSLATMERYLRAFSCREFGW